MEEVNPKAVKIIHLDSPHAIKPYSKSQLLKIYRPISLYVLNKWLKAIEDEIGPIIGKSLSAKQMQIFVKHYGLPHPILIEMAIEGKKAA